MDEQGPGSEIVLGLDDSPSALAALNWAADYARSAGLRLRAVHVISEQMSAMGWTPGVPGMAYLVEPPSTEEVTARMRVIFRQVHPDPGWVLEVERGPSACWSNGPDKPPRSFWAPATTSASNGCWSDRSVTTA